MGAPVVVAALCIAAVLAGILQAFVGQTFVGFLVSVVVGAGGAVLGRWAAVEFGLPLYLLVTAGGETYPLLWSTLGAALLLALLEGLRYRLWVWFG